MLQIAGVCNYMPISWQFEMHLFFFWRILREDLLEHGPSLSAKHAVQAENSCYALKTGYPCTQKLLNRPLLAKRDMCWETKYILIILSFSNPGPLSTFSTYWQLSIVGALPGNLVRCVKRGALHFGEEGIQ